MGTWLNLCKALFGSIGILAQKHVILLTDGENNAGNVDPQTAAEVARAMKVRVYTIGVGTDAGGGGPFGRGGDGVDEASLKKIADTTKGRYFRATDERALKGVYQEIDRLEKSKVESTQFDNFNDLAPWLVIPAVALLALELLGRWTRFVRVP